MDDEVRIVPMLLIDPGHATKNGEFTFEMQPHSNPNRTVRFSLSSQDAEMLYNALGEYLKAT
jgi:hypothetical protein